MDYDLVAGMLRSGINVVTTGDFLTGTRHPNERLALERRHDERTFSALSFAVMLAVMGRREGSARPCFLHDRSH
jgi:hypothetical protein